MALIAIDGRFVGTGTGLANYTKHLLSALVSEGSHDYVVLVRDGVMLDVEVRTKVADITHYSVKEQVRMPGLVASTGCDLAFYPHFNAPMISRVPFVVTVHDLILHRHPGSASALKQRIYRTLLQRNVHQAEAIVAVSEYTRTDLSRTFGPAVGEKTVVSGEGAGATFTPRADDEVQEARSQWKLERDYFLYTGNAKPHKNLGMLVEAHRMAGTPADLVLVTGDPDAQQFAGEGVIVAGGVDDDTLAALYSGARAFTTPSLDEGYCLPIAEALACGCPVIASDCGAIPETAQGHARLVPPTLAHWIDALREPPRKQTPVEVGSWHDAAARTVAAFDVALAGKRAGL